MAAIYRFNKSIMENNGDWSMKKVNFAWNFRRNLFKIVILQFLILEEDKITV